MVSGLLLLRANIAYRSREDTPLSPPGWLLANQGHMEECVSEMPRALAALGTTRFVMRLRWFVFLAEACAECEGSSIGLDVLADGTVLTERTGERMYEAGRHRLKDELSLISAAGGFPRS